MGDFWRIYFVNRFEKVLLTIFFIELFVGGGGRIIDFGFLSLRQVLFITLLITFVARIIYYKEYRNLEVNTFFRLNILTTFIYILISWFFVSAFVGYINGNSLTYIVTDFLRVSFFAAYFPLAYYIAEERFSKQRFITLIKHCAFFVAILTIGISLLGKIVFSSNYEPFKQFLILIFNDDLVFRRSYGVFYKSLFYVFIGLVISLNAVLSKKFIKIDIYNIILCSIALFLSDTRGFLFSIMISVLTIMIIDIKVIIDPIKGISQKISAVLKNSPLLKKSVILLFITISVPFLYQYMTLERFGQSASSDHIPAKDTSLSVRVEYFQESKDMLLQNLDILVYGNGYGSEIAGRVTGIETSFLDILVEQGVIGLIIWLILCLIIILNYLNGYKRGVKITTSDTSLLGAYVGVLLLTNINPFINNPIGISFFLVLLILSRNFRERGKEIHR